MEEIREFVQVANIIHEAQVKLRKDRYVELLKRLTGFAGKFRELARESKKMGAGLARGWLSAAEVCHYRVGTILREMSYSVSQIQPLTEGPGKKLPKLSSLIAELNQLQEEFGDADFDEEENTLSVVTEPIELEGVYLGPFKVQLELDKLSRLYERSPYLVIALEPNPAGTAEEVTHPHVNDEKLCEGDGTVGIRHALEQGRICDFFTMVRSILNTYNAGSSHVLLAEWEGRPCYNCGYAVDSEDSYFCRFCEYDYCEDCSTYCQGCDEIVCLACSVKCNACEETICPRCICTCAECDAGGCNLCFEDDMCPKCKQESEAKENEEQQENRDGTDGPAEEQGRSQASEASATLAS